MKQNKIADLISQIDELNEYNPENGLPDSIFYFVGRNTPFINVDLLIKNTDGDVLLTWRNDIHSGKGWHIPGGIIRFRERIEKRIQMVALTELDLKISSKVKFLEINEIIATNKRERSHFISLLYECYPENDNYDLLNIFNDDEKINFFNKKPKNLLMYHSIYEKYFKNQ
jgi:ADP-ribose pyrophosphatase YjhB (NUDIX family)